MLFACPIDGALCLEDHFLKNVVNLAEVGWLTARAEQPCALLPDSMPMAFLMLVRNLRTATEMAIPMNAKITTTATATLCLMSAILIPGSALIVIRTASLTSVIPTVIRTVSRMPARWTATKMEFPISAKSLMIATTTVSLMPASIFLIAIRMAVLTPATLPTA